MKWVKIPVQTIRAIDLNQDSTADELRSMTDKGYKAVSITHDIKSDFLWVLYEKYFQKDRLP